ncbi:MAG: hypothetical protein QM740_20200 [Acidovorax sp.]
MDINGLDNGGKADPSQGYGYPHADALLRQSERWTVVREPVEGRLPMVLCEPDLAGLKNVGRRLDCALADVLFAVYGLALKGDAEGIRSSQPIDLGAMLASAKDGDGSAPFGYAIWRRDVDTQVGNGYPPSIASTGAGTAPAATVTRRVGGRGDFCLPQVKSAAFFYQRRGPGSDDLAARRAVDRGSYARYDLVTEVSEFEHHVLFECFFNQSAIPSPYVALLLHRYLSGLKDVGALPKEMLNRAAAARQRSAQG